MVLSNKHSLRHLGQNLSDKLFVAQKPTWRPYLRHLEYLNDEFYFDTEAVMWQILLRHIGTRAEWRVLLRHWGCYVTNTTSSHRYTCWVTSSYFVTEDVMWQIILRHIGTRAEWRVSNFRHPCSLSGARKVTIPMWRRFHHPCSWVTIFLFSVTKKLRHPAWLFL